ncbi:MAG: DUF2384 domain-containing protein [Proteobacteria bacterium]|nr:DUF2384 domain-containing protein [Pseudomonadota bacterium]
MARTRQSGNIWAQRMAIATLLRAATADLADARLVLRRGQGRNAAALGRRALDRVVHAVVASEDEWPVEAADTDAIPDDNPIQPDLIAVAALLEDTADQRVHADGRLEPPPSSAMLGDALDRLDDALETLIEAFGIDVAGDSPAARVEPLRSPEQEAPESPPEVVQADQPPTRAASVVSARPPGPRRSGIPVVAGTRPSTDQAKPEEPAIIVGGGPPDPPPPPRRKTRSGQPAAPAPPAQARVVRTGGESARRSRGTATATDGPAPGASQAPRDYTSTVFWALMDRWKLTDAEALDLIGHRGGLTKKGTRPRFKVAGAEAALFGHLREIEAALAPLVGDPAAWLRSPIPESPFDGSSPLDYMTRKKIEGAQAVGRAILLTGLQQEVR